MKHYFLFISFFCCFLANLLLNIFNVKIAMEQEKLVSDVMNVMAMVI